MKQLIILIILLMNIPIKLVSQDNYTFQPFKPPVTYEAADKRAGEILSKMDVEEKILLIGGHNSFFIKGFDEYGIPQLFLSDATQGVHLRKELDNQLEKSTSFPCPLALTATWNVELANNYARSVGEECRAGGTAVLLGPGMNMYRVSQNGRNFEYFGEDPFLTARIIENYVSGVESTGTIATLKHFFLNNTDYHRRTSNSIADERTMHEIYLPAFKAGIDAGAMAVMTSYNQVNGEWASQSSYVINDILRKDLGFRWLVMSDWWATWDPLKTIKSGLDLEMPGDPSRRYSENIYVKTNAARLLKEKKISEDDINRMVMNILRTSIAMGLYDHPIKDETYLSKYDEHEKIALQTGRESVVLLRNQNNILPLDKEKKILLTGNYVDKIPAGGGAAYVEGYNQVTLLDALKNEFGDRLTYSEDPDEDEIKEAEIILLSIVTLDNEGWDRSFNLPDELENNILKIAALNPNVVVIVNSGSGIRMTGWNEKVAALIYAWYPGQNGNTALAEILSGKVNPSGKLPITIEKKFEDSPGYPYLPEGKQLYSGWDGDSDMEQPINNIEYKEGVFIGYRWYESKRIAPLYPFGFGLSYTTFEYNNIKLSSSDITIGEKVDIEFTLKNSGSFAGAEIAQVYIQDVEASVPRPVKELKGFKKVFLQPGESKTISITLSDKELSFWDVKKHKWNAEAGKFNILIGSSSDNILLKDSFTLH